MIKVSITGSTGFVGSNLSKYLAASNCNVEGYSLRAKQWVGSVVASDCIVHLAGKAHDLHNTSNPDEYYRVNFELTKELYNMFLQSDAKQFIFISSVKAAADSLQGILTENIESTPATHYGKSKLAAEQYIQSQPLPCGKTYYILRPCMIHGPGNKGNLNLLYKLVSKGIPYPLASFINSRSFLSVENLCFVIREILEKDDIPSGIYNVADDEPLSTNEVVSLLAQAQNKSPRLLNIPKVLISGLAKLGDRLHLPLTSERLQKLTEDFVVSNKKIKEALNKELPLTAREGLLKTARSFREEQ